MISRAVEAEILRLYHAEGWPIGTIARQLHVHHSTVRRVLWQSGVTAVRENARISKLDAYVPFIAPDAVGDDDLVIDLRSLEEAPQSPFTGAHRLDVDHVAEIATQPTAGRRIVLCCRSGQRALAAADRLRAQGMENLALVALG